MAKQMQYVATPITQDDWFKTYESTECIGLALDNIAKRIRFANKFEGCIEDIYLHYEEFESVFLKFFPQLINHVASHNLEKL